MTTLNPPSDTHPIAESLLAFQKGHPEHPPHPDPNLVSVELNGESVILRRGEYTGQDLKSTLKVPLDHELDLVVSGEFRPIPNDGHYHVRGGETFVSQVGQGQSS